MRFPILISAVLLACTIWSCNDDTTPGGPRVVSTAYLATIYKGYPVAIREELSIEGIVVSSGREGNFYKELVICDQSGGISVKVDDETIWEQYPQWSRVRIMLSGLTLGSYGGRLELGAKSSDAQYQTQFIPAERISQHLMSTSKEPAQPALTAISIKNMRSSSIGSYRMVQNLLYDPSSPASSDDQKIWQGNRCFKDAAGDSIIIRTSEYATFAGKPVPEEAVSPEGVISYFNGVYQLIMVSYDK